MKKRRQRVSHRRNQLASQSTAATANPTVSLVTTSKTKKPEDKAKVLGARRVWGTMKACTVGSVKAVISKCCSNTTAKVKRKSKDAQPGKPSKWWFIVHDEEKSLQILDAKRDLVHVESSWKLEPCYKPLVYSTSSENATLPSALSQVENNASTGQQCKFSLISTVQRGDQPALAAGADSDPNKTVVF